MSRGQRRHAAAGEDTARLLFTVALVEARRYAPTTEILCTTNATCVLNA